MVFSISRTTGTGNKSFCSLNLEKKNNHNNVTHLCVLETLVCLLRLYCSYLSLVTYVDSCKRDSISCV